MAPSGRGILTRPRRTRDATTAYPCCKASWIRSARGIASAVVPSQELPTALKLGAARGGGGALVECVAKGRTARQPWDRAVSIGGGRSVHATGGWA
jgi:hypothetical protein